ncbi:L-cystine transport system permease protein YecS [Starkeya nomas]|uniref:L-cystine transport system permease protein YecS n=2 Tax=Xanthobacteraceae TaxID=335928 RepID=A0A5S9N9S6_9HYPH|nr:MULTISPECIES: amino acid ABC transporter permease [Xanthobacteraceae]TSJ64804.1 amino acid ABC transporter permease [Ancylobacter moscoviensis]CAA0085860.1 L-cystine transport system permease protein YecS [Starkeya nomas]
MFSSLFETTFSLNDLWFMLKGAGVTLALTGWAVLGGTLLGVAFGVVRAVAPWWVNAPLGAVLDVFRSIPLLIQLVLANSFKTIVGIHWSPFTVGCVVLALYMSAYCTEIVRSGFLAVPATTRRAARSLGLSYRQDLTEIVFPIALRVALPSWIGLTLGVMKDTAMVWWIGVVELLRSSQVIVTRIQEPLFVLSIAGLIYFLMSFPIARLGARLEKRWREND